RRPTCRILSRWPSASSRPGKNRTRRASSRGSRRRRSRSDRWRQRVALSLSLVQLYSCVRDNRLGLSEPISRRDFPNGALLAGAGLLLPVIAPTISPAAAFNGYGGIGDYRHANGNTWEVLSAGHALRDGAFETRIAGAIDTGEMYDLVAVGGGISG